MNTGIAFDCVLIVGFATYAFIPFDKKRIRARWAKVVFMVSALIGIARGLIGLAWDLGWFVLSSEASRRLDAYLYMVGDMLLGFIFSLIFSGQLVGTKRRSDSNELPNQPLQATAAPPSS